MIESIGAIQNVQNISDNAAQISPAKNESEFLNILQSGLAGVDANIRESDVAMQRYVVDKDISTHELMIAMEKAKHSLQVTIEVRNKLVEAYKQITQMQV